ncbi:hypothetical protein ONZ45_g1276 [Pleurotus djamor]|nr:hypothetical protein ONZ45_g1276 [Pleurotus djamor]
MGTKQFEFSMPALGRAAFLGQLYNGKTEQLLNTQLFAKNVIDENIKEDTIANTSLSFTDVKSQSDRSKSLKISAELSLSIMGGMISLAGSGEYVDASKSNVSSHEVSATCTVMKKNKRLEVGQCVTQQRWTQVSNMGATHVITAMRFGGTLVANILLKDSNSESDKQIKGSFSASIMEGMSSQFSAKGSASVDSSDTGKDLNTHCEFKVYGDWASSDQSIPTTVGEVFELIKSWPSLVGDGVPCTLTLTPIAQFVDTSPEALVLYELEQHKMMSLCQAYDDFYRLSGRRAKLVSSLESTVGDFCPTFLYACQEKKLAVEQALGIARGQLTQYLTAFREKGASGMDEGVEEFIIRMKKNFTDGVNACKVDEAKVDLLRSVSKLASDQNAPLASVGRLRSHITSLGGGAVGVVIVPPSPNLSSATNTFSLLVQSIRKWREEEDKKLQNSDGTGPKTSFSAFYADPEFDSDFLSLEGKRGILKRGLDQAKESGESCFLHYGLVSNTVKKEYDWSLLNNEGWGFIANEEENFYYVGQVRSGQRHGRGTVTYADGSMYIGDWWQDQRHGDGKLIDSDGNVENSGVYIDNMYRNDGIILKVSILKKDGVLKDAHQVPLRKYDSTPSHILRIGGMLGWADKDEFRLKLVSKTKAFPTMEMEVKGKMLMPGSNDELYTAGWPLDQGAAEIKATIL